MRLFIISMLFLSLVKAQGTNPGEGYAIVRNDTIYGEIRINFDQATVMIKQDSVNRMILNGIQLITLLNDDRDTYVTFEVEGKNRFFKRIVAGDFPLYIKDDKLLGVIEDELVPIESEKVLFNIFGKKEVKDISFVRNISLTESSGIIELYRYFNDYAD